MDSGLEFPERARRVEERVRAIERRVAAAADAVQDLAKPATPPRPGTIKAIRSHSDDESSDESTETQPEEPTPPNINRVSFEQLREIGLSVTEAARLLASRDARGAFKSFDELNDLWGFSKELVEKLRARLSLR